MATNKSQTVNITVPSELLKQVDALAKRDFTSRSDIIRQALLDKIRRPIKTEELDEFGDEGRWDIIADFRDLPGGGLPADEFIKRVKALDGQDQ